MRRRRMPPPCETWTSVNTMRPQIGGCRPTGVVNVKYCVDHRFGLWLVSWAVDPLLRAGALTSRDRVLAVLDRDLAGRRRRRPSTSQSRHAMPLGNVVSTLAVDRVVGRSARRRRSTCGSPAMAAVPCGSSLLQVVGEDAPAVVGVAASCCARYGIFSLTEMLALAREQHDVVASSCRSSGTACRTSRRTSRPTPASPSPGRRDCPAPPVQVDAAAAGSW